VGAQEVDKYVNVVKIHYLWYLSTYYLRLSTYYFAINCTFATEKLIDVGQVSWLSQPNYRKQRIE